MTMTMEKAQLNNQSILQNFGLVEEIDEQTAEIISGGKSKKFTIKNNTTNAIDYTIDDVKWNIAPGGTNNIYTDYRGKVSFDKDTRANEINVGRESLKDGQNYEFKLDAGNPDIINLSKI